MKCFISEEEPIKVLSEALLSSGNEHQATIKNTKGDGFEIIFSKPLTQTIKDIINQDKQYYIYSSENGRYQYIGVKNSKHAIRIPAKPSIARMVKNFTGSSFIKSPAIISTLIWIGLFLYGRLYITEYLSRYGITKLYYPLLSYVGLDTIVINAATIIVLFILIILLNSPAPFLYENQKKDSTFKQVLHIILLPYVMYLISGFICSTIIYFTKDFSIVAAILATALFLSPTLMCILQNKMARKNFSDFSVTLGVANLKYIAQLLIIFPLIEMRFPHISIKLKFVLFLIISAAIALANIVIHLDEIELTKPYVHLKKLGWIIVIISIFFIGTKLAKNINLIKNMHLGGYYETFYIEPVPKTAFLGKSDYKSSRF